MLLNNARNLESVFSILIRVLENGARHVVDPCHSSAFPNKRPGSSGTLVDSKPHEEPKPRIAFSLLCPVLSSRARACRRDHRTPSAPLPDVGVAFVRETFPPPAETLLSGHRSYEHMCRSRVALLCFGSSPRSRNLCRLLLAPAAIRIFSTLFCESFLGCLVPCPGGPIGCMRLLTSPMSSAFPLGGWVGFPLLVHDATFRGNDFRDCRHSVMFRPPSLFASQVAPTATAMP